MHTTNYQKISDYINVIYSKNSFKQHLKDQSEYMLISWTILIDDPDDLRSSLTFVEKYNSQNPNNQILPIARDHATDLMIGILNGRYIDFDTQMVKSSIAYYDTPEELWQKVIKPSLETYHDIIIDE